MKLVEFKYASGDGVVFVNPSRVLTAEAFSKTSKTTKLFFGGGSTVEVSGNPAEVAAALSEGMQ